MTGLSLEHDALIEVAALVTDFDLNQLGEGVDLVIKPPQAALEQMGEFVTRMHTDSGLIDELENGISLSEANERVLAYVREWVPEPRRAPLGGNTVATDRGFLARDLPELDAWLHYRIIDVSSIKELSRRWYPRAYINAPEKNGGHRALADIRESIAELRYYREAVFVAPRESQSLYPPPHTPQPPPLNPRGGQNPAYVELHKRPNSTRSAWATNDRFAQKPALRPSR